MRKVILPMEYYINRIFSLDMKQDSLSYGNDGCLRIAISDVMSRDKDIAKENKYDRSNLFSKHGRLSTSPYGEAPSKKLFLRAKNYIKRARKISKVLVYMCPECNDTPLHSDTPREDLKVWLGAVNRNVGGLPQLGGRSVNSYYTHLPFEFKKTDNQFLVYFRASLYRMPLFYPVLVNDFCRNYKKHRNFWLSLYAAHVAATRKSSDISVGNTAGQAQAGFRWDHHIFSPNFSSLLYAIHLIRTLRKRNGSEELKKCRKSLFSWGSVEATRTSYSFGVLTTQTKLEKHFDCRITVDNDKIFSAATRRLVRLGAYRAVKEALAAGNNEWFTATRVNKTKER